MARDAVIGGLRGGYGRAPTLVHPSNGVGILLILVDVLENALGVELADGIDTIGETNLNVDELLHDS